MHVTIVYKGKIPTKYYGDARDIWYLGKELVKLGNKVTYLVDKGSFALLQISYTLINIKILMSKFQKKQI